MNLASNTHRLADADKTSLKKANRYCADLARSAAGNFYYAFSFLPTQQRRGVQAIYAFCRLGDDAADEVRTDPAAELQQLWEKLDICYEGYYKDDLTLALADTIHRFKLERSHFDELLCGLESDLTVNRYQSFEDLKTYCYRVASTVGLICLKIFGADTDKSRLYAEYLGIGMQLTNILRDMKEDMNRNRIYIPQEDLERFELTNEMIFATENLEKLIKLVKWEADRTEHFFRKADDIMPMDMKNRLFAARIMAAIYRKLLHRIKQLESFDSRIELTPLEKIHIAYKILADNNKTGRK